MLTLASCTKNYYQVFKVSAENGKISNTKIVFEDKNCSVSYNLWSQKGSSGFSVFNKTENDLIVDLSKTFFVLNGYAYQYSENPEFTIPPKTSRSVLKYVIVDTLFTHCDLKRKPTKNNPTSIKYEKLNSPFVFYNLITYKTKSETERFENKFFVSEISNVPFGQMFSYIDTTKCGIRYDDQPVMKSATADRFYMKYSISN